jgi:hypothetical protein
MKRIMLFIVFLFVSSSVHAEQFNVTYVGLQPKSIKVFKKDDGKYLWQYTTQAQTLEIGGRTMLKITEDCKGIWNNRDERTWKSESYYSYENNRIEPDHTMLTFYDPKGNIVEKIEKGYSRKDKKVYCVKNRDKKEFDFEDDLIDKEVLGVCMMNFPLWR